MVAVLFGFAGGLLVPRKGPDGKAVQITVALIAAIGIVTWVFADDVFAGPSLTVGGVAAMLGIAIRRQPETEGN